MSTYQLLWLRQDLRTFDHSALHHAMAAGPTIAIVILSPQQWRIHQDAAIKIDFYLRQLASLQQQLQALNVPLLLLRVENWRDIAAAFADLAQQLPIKALYTHIESGSNEQLRDHMVKQTLQCQNITSHFFHDQTLFPFGSIRNKTGQPYQVFGAFKKQCYERLSVSLPQCYPVPEAQPAFDLALAAHFYHIPRLSELGFADIPPQQQALWPVGEDAALDRLDDFIANQVEHYRHERDYPDLNGTSQLSPYLNTGLVSIRACVQALFRAQYGDFHFNNEGQQTWLDELLWREFYQHIVFDFPQVSKHLPFKHNTQQIAWRNAAEDLAAWQQGQTGIPIVDAGMRQMQATGWMHNRVRMIVAMFFSKNLLLDWRLGEAWFMQHLIDGNLAANNGGWQWCASTGTDAVPYFRIFNPVSQSQKFDPQGDYIRRWVPELADLDAKEIHDPYAKQPHRVLNYPRPMVDLKKSRLRALEAFKAV